MSRLNSALLIVLGLLGTAVTTGCSTVKGVGPLGDIAAIPAHRVPREVLARPRANMQQISLQRLRQAPSPVYLLGPGDTLGVHIPFVLGKADEAPPVTNPEREDLLPAVGYPISIREDGKVGLPLVGGVKVEGLTVAQATAAITRAYVDKELLLPGDDKVLVTLMRRRKIVVNVIREEGGFSNAGGFMAGGMMQPGLAAFTSKRGTGQRVALPVYENDVLNALTLTGGLPGLDASNAVYIIRGGSEDAADFDKFVAEIQSSVELCECVPLAPLPPNVLRIPIRFHPEDLPTFTEDDIILNNGDIVYIPTRESERYYTGGVLRGGEFLLPRDYDLDVLSAIAIAGGPISNGSSGVRFGGFGGAGAAPGSVGAPPTNLTILRKLPCGGKIPIAVDLRRALVDGSHNILVAPEDTLILRFRLGEEIYNTILSLLQFNFIFPMFRGGF
jgi:protein involved in polysaccharide export with SLBB domain